MAAAELSPCVRCRRARTERAGGLPCSASKAWPGAAACRHNRGCLADRTEKAPATAPPPPPRRRPRVSTCYDPTPRSAGDGRGDRRAGSGRKGTTPPTQRAAAPPQGDRIMDARREGGEGLALATGQGADAAPPGRAACGRCSRAAVRSASKRPQKASKYYH